MRRTPAVLPRFAFAAALLAAVAVGCVAHAPRAPHAPRSSEPAATQSTLGPPVTVRAGTHDAMNHRPPSDTDLRDSHRRHAALAQFHRWFLLYENPDYGVENALDALAPDVTVASGLGTAVGHDAYRTRVAELPATWQNAHRVRDADVTFPDDGTTRLTAQVTYLNRGLRPDGSVRTAELTYEATLADADPVLPRFTAIRIEQQSEGDADAFAPAYAENRLRSLAHHWLALVEHPDRAVEPFRAVLAEGFVLNFSSGPIDTMDGLATWLAGPASAVDASGHRIDRFAFAPIAGRPDAYRVELAFAWHGLTSDGDRVTARTGHTWTVTDDPMERFARLERVDVEVLEPLRPLAER